MRKIWLIIQREYLTRVKNKSFILTTLLTPLAFLVFFVVVALVMSYKSDKLYTVGVIDHSAVQLTKLENTKKLNFEYFNLSLEQLKEKYKRKELDGILVFPKVAGVDVKKYTVYFHSDAGIDIELEQNLSKAIEKNIKHYKMQQLQLSQEVLDKLDIDVLIDPESISEGVQERSSYTSMIASGIGGVIAYIIFFIIIFYGVSIMRSITEEKINRIVEIIITSVQAKELMIGKIIGVSLVGFTQILVWLILIPIIYIIGIQFMGVDPEQIQQLSGSQNAETQKMVEHKLPEIIAEISKQNWFFIGLMFILYFLGGFFLYASMFAAIGAAIGDDINDSQSMTFPVMVPIMISVYMMFSVIREPFSNLAVISSMIPFMSPIIMPSRIAFGVPWYEIVISLILLYGCAWLMIILAARIYRTGILMYGKKATAKEMWKWMRNS